DQRRSGPARGRARAACARGAVHDGAIADRAAAHAMSVSAFRATYRLQLGTDLDLRAARELLPYLDDLGISHVYLSPVWQARPGSTHGYDVIDPAAISRELGGEAELRALGAEARDRGMGLILDVVPNH